MAGEMSKVQMAEEIERLQKEIEVLKASRKKGSGRKLELLEQLAKGSAKVLDVANAMGVTSKNVSSLLCYLKKDGWGIITNEDGERQITRYKGEEVDQAFIESYVSKEREIMKANEKDQQG